MVTCTSIIFGMKRSVTGGNAEIKDVTLVTVQAALSANESYSGVRSNPAVMPGQHSHDRFAVCLAGIQAGSGK